MYHDLEGCDCQFVTSAFCWTLGTSEPNHVVQGMDEASPAEGHTASMGPLGLLSARACIMHWVDTLLIKRNTGLALLCLQVFWARQLVDRLTSK